MSIPTTARTAKHRVNLKYVNERLNFELARDFYLNVVNDGSWKTHPVIEAMKEAYPAVVTFQQGMPCEALGIGDYAGAADTCFISKHRVSDRNNDFVNYGSAEYISIGCYSLITRGLIRFDLNQVPKAAKVAKACLQVYLYAKRRPSALQAYEVLKPWGEGRGTGSRWIKQPVANGEASWLCHQHPAKWDGGGCSVPGKDRAQTPAGQGQPVPGEKGWVSVELDPKLVQRWIGDPESNRGLLLKDKTEANGTECRYRSLDFEDAGMRPRLVIAFSSGVKARRPGSQGAARRTAARAAAKPPARKEAQPEDQAPEGLGVIHLKDGGKLVVKRFWPCGRGVCYELPDGTEGTVGFSSVTRLEAPTAKTE